MELKDILPFLDPETLKRWTEYQSKLDWSMMEEGKRYTIETLADFIRNKGFGGDVRESIAQAIEWINDLTDKQILNEKQTQILTDSLKAKYQELEDRYDAQIGALTEDSEVIDARGGKATLGQRLDDTDEQLAQKANDGYFLQLDETFDLNYSKSTTSDMYYSMYDDFLTDGRVRKRNLGLDQSNQYPINLYIFEPSNFKRTLFVTCAIHGSEHYSTLVMHETLRRVLRENDLQFNDLRETRILVIPVANPWGVNQTDSSNMIRRGNSRGVDLNRNFDYKWVDGTGNGYLTFGLSPFSEVESQYIRDVFNTYMIDFYLDLHSFGDSETETRDYLFYGNTKIANNTDDFIKWLNRTYSGLNVSHETTANDATSNNYAIEVLNVPAINIELIRLRHEKDDVRWVELLMNYLKFQSRTYDMTNTLNYGSKVDVPVQNLQTVEIGTEWEDITGLNYVYHIDTDGLMMVSGFVSCEITSTELDTLITIAPAIEQERNLISLDVSSGYRQKPYLKAKTGIHTLSFSCVVPVKRVNGNATFRCKIIREGSGTANIKRHHANYVFIPSTLTHAKSKQHE